MKKKIFIFIFSTLILCSSIFSGCEKKDKSNLQTNKKIEKLVLDDSDIDSIKLKVYFDSSKDDKQGSISAEERLIKKDELLGELIIHELIKGPSRNSKSKPILPKNTRLLSFSIKDKIAYINFSKDIFAKTMTLSKEQSCLDGIISSLSSLPSVNKIKILVENKDIDTLGGHFDISKPLGRTDLNNALKK